MLDEDVAQLLLTPALQLQVQGAVELLVGQKAQTVQQVADTKFALIAPHSLADRFIGDVSELPHNLAQGLGHVQLGRDPQRILRLLDSQVSFADQKLDNGIEGLFGPAPVTVAGIKIHVHACLRAKSMQEVKTEFLVILAPGKPGADGIAADIADRSLPLDKRLWRRIETEPHRDHVAHLQDFLILQ
jgi:hypothetical protein